MTDPGSVFFYISGHGFGHATRQAAIINALLRRAANPPRIVLRTSAPAWLFERTIRGPFQLLPGPTDPGAVQLDALRVDEAATVDQALAFYDILPRLAEEEAALLRGRAAVLAVSDTPPLACAAAAAVRIPAVVCGNFTWDWIYGDYVDGHPRGEDLIGVVQREYARAAGAWRLPMHGGFDTVAPVVDVPLVARHARSDQSADEVRRALGLPLGAPLVLVSFGGYGAGHLPLDRLDCLSDWRVVVTAPAANLPIAARGVDVVADETIHAWGLGYEDLVAAVDVVVTKPGYGIVSDCAANDTALLYTSRGRFAEYDVMVRELPRFVRAQFIPQADLLAGRWQDALARLREAPQPPTPRTDGADVVAALILELLDATSRR